jgi:error-prone DNA polymerase
VSYTELHARSAFSFLRGASLPEDLIQAALKAELPAVALLDREGVYGAPRFYSSAHENGFAVQPRVGAEITMEDGSVVPLLVTSRQGYQNLCQLITETKLTPRSPELTLPDLPPGIDPHERKRPCFATWAELARFNTGLIALTGPSDVPDGLLRALRSLLVSLSHRVPPRGLRRARFSPLRNQLKLSGER